MNVACAIGDIASSVITNLTGAGGSRRPPSRRRGKEKKEGRNGSRPGSSRISANSFSIRAEYFMKRSIQPFYHPYPPVWGTIRNVSKKMRLKEGE